MELRSLVLLGLCVMAVSQCSEARHSMHRRETDDDDLFSADEPQDDYQELPNDTPGTIQSEQAKILTKPRTYEVKAGTDVKLECHVDPDNGTVVQWYKGSDLYFINKMKMFMESNYYIDNDSKDLIIPNIQESDSGVFKCELVQEQTVNVSHTVVVLAAPRIIRVTATNAGTVVEGQDLDLTCEVTGIPPPQILWSRSVENGNQRLGEQDGEFSTNSVHIKDVKREYSGKYYCYAINSVGHNQAEIEIYVAGKPHVHVHRPVINSAINVQAILECSTKFDYNPHIRWYMNGSLIEDSSTSYIVSTRNSHSNLTVIPQSNADFGTFTCEAQNDIGKHNRSIMLVQSPVIEDFSSEAGKLLWTVHSHQPIVEIHVQLRNLNEVDSIWKKFDVPLPSSSSHKYNLVYDLNDKHLEPGKYEAVVAVRNENSWSDMIDPVVAEIDVEPELIQHASVFRGGSNAHSTRPTSFVLSAILIYLLVRM